MGIPVVEGRAFQPTDAIGDDRARSTRRWRGRSTRVRARLAAASSRRPRRPNVPCFTIVGVLKDVKQGGVDQKTGTELYFNFEQLTTTAAAASASAR